MKIIGLTGSIGMGKSTTADLFAGMGVPVYSSDNAVHDIYSGPDARLIENRFPGTVENGVVNREKLSQQVLGHPEKLAMLEAIVHPLVRQAEAAFLDKARKAGHALVVLDIPLLFETGREQAFDAIVVVSAPEEIQRQRVLARAGMTAEKLEKILARQMPDHEKRQLAHYVIDTSKGIENAREAVARIIGLLTSPDHAKPSA